MPQPIPPVPPEATQRPGGEPHPAPRFQEEPSPIRKVLMGLPVLLVATAFGAIVWLAYVEGQSTALGEPPLVRAIPEPIKVSPDPALASNEDNAVEDLLEESAEPPPEAVLQPRPEEPILTDSESRTAEAPLSPGAGGAEVPASQATRPAGPADGGSQQTAALAQDPTAASPPTANPAPASREPAPTPQASEPPAPPAADPTPAAEPVAEPEPAPPPTQITAPRPAPQRPTPPPEPRVEPTAPQSAAGRRRPAQTTGTAPRIARVTPAPVESSGPQISPSGIEQAPAPGEADRDRLRLEPPPPVLARAPSPTDSPPAQAAPPIVAAPGDDGRSATQPTYRIQLASVREEADARRAWDLYRLELGDVLADFAPVIERAEIANGTFYRVQAGAFGDRLEAEAICEELKARNTACLVVRR